MKTRCLLVLTLTAACTDVTVEGDITKDNIQKYVQTMCGPVPTAPSFAVAYENGQAILSAEAMQNIVAWRSTQIDWDNCLFTLNGK